MEAAALGLVNASCVCDHDLETRAGIACQRQCPYNLTLVDFLSEIVIDTSLDIGRLAISTREESSAQEPQTRESFSGLTGAKKGMSGAAAGSAEDSRT